MPISAVRWGRYLVFAGCLGGALSLAAIAPAHAQFVCGGSGAGAEPQTGGGSSGNGGSVACGLGVSASGNFGTAIGTSFGATTTASGTGSVAIGFSDTFTGQTLASGTSATAIGSGSHATADDTIAIGTSAQASGTSGIAIGRQAQANGGQFNIAMGDLAFINPTYSQTTVIGGRNLVNGSNTVALGFGAGTFFNDRSDNSVAIGVGAKVDGNNSTAVGQGAAALGASSTALGQGANAGFANSTAIGAGATTTRANQVAVGTATSTYTMPGITSAASLAAQSGPVSLVTTDAAGNLATLNASNIASVTALSALDGRVTNLETNVRSLNADMRKAFEGSAVAIAMGGAALPDNKKFAISANWGNFSGENAFGGMAQVRLSNSFVANAAVGAGFARGGVGGRVGGTLAW